MILLHSIPLLHNNLFIATTLIVLGFLGMLLQRNALATVFSLLIWLQGAGLVLISYGQYQNSRESHFYLLIILFFIVTLLCTLASLIFSTGNSSPNSATNEDFELDSHEPTHAPLTQAGTGARE